MTSDDPALTPALAEATHIRTVTDLVREVNEESLLAPGAFNATDSGNAKRFSLLYRQVVRYAADSARWYVWTGSHWRPDVDDLTVLALTLGVSGYIRGAELDLHPQDSADRYRRWASSSESESARRKMLRLAATDPAVQVREADLDADPLVLVVRNGTVDLRTGELRESKPEDLCTRRADVWYDPAADCPLWRGHVELVTGGDPVLVAYLQRACGYALTGLVDEQKFWFLWGDGQNGKNVFVETLLGLLGDYGQVAPPSLLTGGGSQHPTILADLRGARAVMSDETGHERINDTRLKMLTGSKRVKARFMGKDFFEYDSTMKLWVLGNAKPAIRDQSEGTWRRMQLVPFTVRIPDEVLRADFARELETERSGILNWCLEGLRGWQELGGVGTPEVVRAAVAEYREEEDEIGQWLESCCGAAGDDEYVSNPALYGSYQLWAVQNGIRPQDVLNRVMWGRAITGRSVGSGKIGDSVPLRVEGAKLRVRYGVKLIKTVWSTG